MSEKINVVYVKEFENGKVYVGVTCQFKIRMQRHERDAKAGKLDYPLYRAMRKYKHSTKIVFESSNYSEVLQKEIKLIANYKNNGVGVYNITNGGQGHLGHHPSEETRKKLSESRKGITLSEETRTNLRKVNLGKNKQKKLNGNKANPIKV